MSTVIVYKADGTTNTSDYHTVFLNHQFILGYEWIPSVLPTP